MAAVGACSLAFWACASSCIRDWRAFARWMRCSGSSIPTRSTIGPFTSRPRFSLCSCTPGVFAFQIWIAERVLLTIFSRQGVEAWRSMVNEVNIDRLRDHFIICGYGQVGRTVVDQLRRLEIPFVLIETNEGLYHELLNERTAVIQGDAKRHDMSGAAPASNARAAFASSSTMTPTIYTSR